MSLEDGKAFEDRKVAITQSGSDHRAGVRSLPALSLDAAGAGGRSLQAEPKVSVLDRINLLEMSYEGDAHVQCRLLDEGEKFVLFIPRHGAARVVSRNREVLSVPGVGAILTGEVGNRCDILGQRRHICVVAPMEALTSRLSAMLDRPVTGDFWIEPRIDLTTGPGLLLSALVRSMEAMSADNTLATAPRTRAALSDVYFNLILEALPHRYSEELAKPEALVRPRYVKRAVDYMQANLAEPFSLEVLAQACQVAPRTLQNGFRHFLKTSPKAYLEGLRLEAAQRALLQATRHDTVAEIAQRFGFSHLGRFSAQYRRLYGQLPSQTLRDAHGS